jgi:hypothetical protein
MKTVWAAAIAAAAVVAAGTAHADRNVCVWTGIDWACGDGNTFTRHFTKAQGPNVIIAPQRTAVVPAREPTLYSPPGSR